MGEIGEWKDILVDGSTMHCYLTTPEQATGRGVLVCMHGPGIDDFIKEICARLAASGFATIAPDFYHRQAHPQSDSWTKIKDSEAIQDMQKAIEALKSFSKVDGQRIGVIGFCMGGRLAFLYAANNPDLRAATVFHGGNIMVSKDGEPSPFDQAGNIKASMLGLFGVEDENPSPADVAKISAALTKLGKHHNFNIYDGAGHAFLNFTRPSAFRESQAKEAWAKCLAWLDQYL